MDSEHRHELKTNDLEEFLRNFSQFWNKHGTYIMLVLAALAVIFLGSRLYRTSQYQAHEGAWADLAAASTPEALRDVAMNHREPAVQALALITAADQLLEQIRTPPAMALPDDDAAANAAMGGPGQGAAGGTGGEIGNDPEGGDGDGEDANEPPAPDVAAAGSAVTNDDAPGAPTAEQGEVQAGELNSAMALIAKDDLAQRKQKLELAQRMYQDVVDLPGVDALYKLHAQLGLAAVAENENNWERAGQLYQQVANDAEQLGYPAVATEAKTRRELLPSLGKPLLLVSAPAPEADQAPMNGPGAADPASPADNTSRSDQADAAVLQDTSNAQDTANPQDASGSQATADDQGPQSESAQTSP